MITESWRLPDDDSMPLRLPDSSDASHRVGVPTRTTPETREPTMSISRRIVRSRMESPRVPLRFGPCAPELGIHLRCAWRMGREESLLSIWESAVR